jgi:hypothetical protein
MPHLGKRLGASITPEQAGCAHSSNASYQDEDPELATDALPGRHI